MKINKEELNRPVIKEKSGGLATLKEVLEGKIAFKEEMDFADYRELAIARYEMMDPNKAINLGGVSYTRKQIIEQIKKRTEVGKTLVEMQVRFVRMLLDRREEININWQNDSG
jgi:hypothetical protein